MRDRFELWDKALTDLIDAYRDVERRAMALPLFVPLLISPSRPTRSRRDAASWPLVPRSLIDYFLAEHFGRRLRLARRSVLVDHSLTPDEQDHLTGQIDRALQIWPPQPVVDLLIRYVLPFGGLLAGLVALVRRMLAELFRQPSGVPPSWLAIALGYVILLCLLPALAWTTKRSLMGSAGGASVYGVESRLFGPLAPPRHELPLDLINIFVAFTLFAIWMVVVETSGLPFLIGPMVLVALALEAGVVAVVVGRLIHRRRLGRW